MNLHVKHVLGWVIAINFLTMVLALSEFTNTVWAHGPMDHQEELKKGPHGGPVFQFGMNYVECMVDHEIGYIVIFFFDEDMKPIPLPKYHSASGYLTMADGSIIWVTFRAAEEDTTSHLKAETGIKEIGSFKAVVSIKDGENRENFRFRWVPAAASE
ncbi:MAG: hypothetical protein AB1598_00685 [Thermodesulfobacteriota bacterium]